MKRLLTAAFVTGLFLICKPSHAIENDAYKYSQVKSTTTFSTVPVKLHAVTITDSVNVAFIIYDSTSTDNTTVPLAKFEASAAAGTYLFNVQTQNGLAHVGAANGAEVTVSYR